MRVVFLCIPLVSCGFAVRSACAAALWKDSPRSFVFMCHAEGVSNMKHYRELKADEGKEKTLQRQGRICEISS
jgi:hypothetical protein